MISAKDFVVASLEASIRKCLGGSCKKESRTQSD